MVGKYSGALIYGKYNRGELCPSVFELDALFVNPRKSRAPTTPH